MREIKFRGRSVDSDEWVYGNLVECDYREYHCFIVVSADWEEEIFVDAWDNKVKQVDLISQEIYGVNPETVGQYTGMNDCDGVEIYVNDIVIITYSEDGETNEEIRVVSDAGKGQGYSPLNWGEICKSCDHCVEINSIKVIGNIYENLELMEVE